MEGVYICAHCARSLLSLYKLHAHISCFFLSLFKMAMPMELVPWEGVDAQLAKQC